MREDALVSVIIPTFNRSRTIKPTLTSCMNQTHRPLEIIVVDDGSVDSTQEKVESFFEQETQGKVYCIYQRQENLGAPAARNLGLKISKGEYIQWIDSDDTMSRGKISNQIDLFSRRSDIDVAYCSWRIKCPGLISYGPIHQRRALDSNDKLLRGYLSTTWFCPLHAYLFRRDVVEEIGGFDLTLKRRQDTDLLNRVLLKGYRFGYSNKGLVYYHRGDGDHIGSRKYYAEHFGSLLKVIEKAYRELNASSRLSCYHGELEEYLRMLAKEAIKAGYLGGYESTRDCYYRMFGHQWSEDWVPYTTRPNTIYSSARFAVHRLLGDCGIDWLKKVFGKLEYT